MEESIWFFILNTFDTVVGVKEPLIILPKW